MTLHSYILHAQPQTHARLFFACVVELLLERLKLTSDQALLMLNSPDPQTLFSLCQEAALLAQEPFRDSAWAKRWKEAREAVELCAGEVVDRLEQARQLTSKSCEKERPLPRAHAQRLISATLFDGLAAAEWCLEIDFVHLSLQEKRDRLVESPFKAKA